MDYPRWSAPKQQLERLWRQLTNYPIVRFLNAVLCKLSILIVLFSRCFCIEALFGRRRARYSGGIGRGRLYISQTCANMLSTYDLACNVPLLVLMLVCIRAGFCFELGWVREPIGGSQN